jgi:hypothetical protein
MATKPEPPKPISWNVYKIASKAVWLGQVWASDKAAAIEKIQAVGREVDGARNRQKFPYHAALPAEKVRDRVDRDVIFCAAGVLSATPLTYSMRRDDGDFVVFCFGEPEDAESFAKRFGGKRLPECQRQC